MNLSILEPSDYLSMPWRNGLGITVEIAKQDLPAGNGFAWRLSMADVTTNGPFSNFSDYDRCLLLLEGNGLDLDCGNERHRLEQPLQAARFRGEDSTVATLHDGPIKDFNIMTHREICTASIDSQAGEAAASIGVNADALLIYAVNGDLRLESNALPRMILPMGHMLIARETVEQVIHCHAAGFIITQIHNKPNSA